MALDPRLADVTLLALAALRARERQVTAPRHTVVLQIVYYDALGIEPPLEGERYTVKLPAPAPGGRP